MEERRLSTWVTLLALLIGIALPGAIARDHLGLGQPMEAHPATAPRGPRGLATIPVVESPEAGPGKGWIADRLLDGGSYAARSPSIDTDPSGFLHATWLHDMTGTGNWLVLYSVSKDRGATWAQPVAISGNTNPDSGPEIAVSPIDGRIYVAYAIDVTGTSTVLVAYSDNGAAWTRIPVLESAFGEFGNLDVAFGYAEPPIPPGYNVYVAFDEELSSGGRILHVNQSQDRGASYASSLCLGCISDGNAYGYPALVYQRGPGQGGNATFRPDTMFLAYVAGASPNLGTVYLTWSTDYGATWEAAVSVQASEGFEVQSTAIAASFDGDTLAVAWQRDDPGDTRIRYALQADPNNPTGQWVRGTFDNPGEDDLGPRLAVAGEGTNNRTIGGNFHLVWTVGGPEWHLEYTMRPTNLADPWSSPQIVSDPTGKASVEFSRKGLTTNFWAGVWYPAVVWTDFRNLPPYDIYFTTPGSRVTVGPMAPGPSFEVDGATYTSSRVFNWSAGVQHSLGAPSPQQSGEDTRYAWLSWSDGGPQSHLITATETDTVYRLNFDTQYLFRVDTSPGGLLKEVDGASSTIPLTSWAIAGSDHIIGVPSPQAAESGKRYVWTAWSDGGNQNHIITMTAPRMLIATFVTQYLVTIETSPQGLHFEADGETYQSPSSFWWNASSIHTILVVDVQGELGFVEWSDGGAIAHSVTVNRTETILATFGPRESTVPLLFWLSVPAAAIIVQAILTRKPRKPGPTRREKI